MAYRFERNEKKKTIPSHFPFFIEFKVAVPFLLQKGLLLLLVLISTCSKEISGSSVCLRAWMEVCTIPMVHQRYTESPASHSSSSQVPCKEANMFQFNTKANNKQIL